MKKNVLFTAMLGMVLAFGMAVIGCNNGNDGGKNDPKTLVITNISADMASQWQSSFELGVFPAGTTAAQALARTGIVAAAGDDITFSNSAPYTASVLLYAAPNFTNTWTGSGTYDVYITLGSNNYYWKKNISFTSASTTVNATSFSTETGGNNGDNTGGNNGGNTGGNNGDTWSDVTSLSQMNGTWKGSYSETMTIQDTVEQDGYPWSNEMATMFGNMNVTVNVEMTMTFNASAGTVSQNMKVTYTFSGENINTAWSTIKEMGSEVGVTVNDANHSITMTQDLGSVAISLDELSGVQINQNGTKGKVPVGTMGDDLPEIIFVKQ